MQKQERFATTHINVRRRAPLGRSMNLCCASNIDRGISKSDSPEARVRRCSVARPATTPKISMKPKVAVVTSTHFCRGGRSTQRGTNNALVRLTATTGAMAAQPAQADPGLPLARGLRAPLQPGTRSAASGDDSIARPAIDTGKRLPVRSPGMRM